MSDKSLLQSSWPSSNIYQNLSSRPITDRIARFYAARRAVSLGSFQLTAGGTTDYYIDGRLVTTHPPALDYISSLMARVIDESGLRTKANKIVVPVLSGVTLGVALALKTGLDLVMDRGIRKEHGMARRFEGLLAKGDKAIVIDDLLTTGMTLLQTIEGLENEAVVCLGCIVLVDREEGGTQALVGKKVPLLTLIRGRELVEYVKAFPGRNDSKIHKGERRVGQL